MRRCEYQGCEGTERSKGLCGGHYEQRRVGKELRPLQVRDTSPHPSICTFESCSHPYESRGYCKSHAAQLRAGIPLHSVERQTICGFDSCSLPYACKGYCQGHYLQMKKGQELRPIIKYDPICTIPRCGLPHLSKGLCKKHWKQSPVGIASTKKYLESPKGRAYQRHHRYRRRGLLEGDPIPKDFKLGPECTFCGSTENLSVEHILPISRGGSNQASNLTTYCRHHNSEKGSKTFNEWMEWRKKRDALSNAPCYSEAHPDA